MDMLTGFEALGSFSATGLAYLGAQSYGYGARYWRLPPNPEIRRSHRDLARIRRTWPRLARHTGLILRDTMPSTIQTVTGAHGGQRAAQARIRVPRVLRAVADAHGVTLDFRTLPSVGIAEFTAKSQYLADYWGMTRVSAVQLGAGTVRVRAVRQDPLEQRLVLDRPVQVPAGLEHVPLGVDDMGVMVPLPLAHSTGVGVYGAPRWGKTSLILGVLTAVAHRVDVQIILADGKSSTGFESDYYDVGHRCAAVIGDDLAEYNRLIKEVQRIRQIRQSSLRSELGVANFWDHGPSAAWPLILVVIDEAHSYFRQISPAGNNTEIKASNTLAAENAWVTEDLVKKCGSVGIYFIIATQKPTADAIPTGIRANLTHGLCLGVREQTVVVAALGESIKDFPSASPMQFMRNRFRGCAVMISECAEGFTRFRTPYCPPALTAAVAAETRHLVTTATLPTLTTGQAHLGTAPCDISALLPGRPGGQD